MHFQAIGIFFKKLFKMFRLGALFNLSGMEFQNKAPLYLDEFLPTSRLIYKAANLKLNAIA